MSCLSPISSIHLNQNGAKANVLKASPAKKMKISGVLKRGALIVLEGCDRAGKSTQTSMLLESLQKRGINSKVMKFPDDKSETGQLIRKYLKGSVDVEDHAIHLLFAANRWELAPTIESDLIKGTTIVMDRYSYSGVAYSAAKKVESMTREWCCSPEVGLPSPDLVLYLELPPDHASQRNGYGDERYEKKEFQARVRKEFRLLKDTSVWKTIDASEGIENVHTKILDCVIDVVNDVQNKGTIKRFQQQGGKLVSVQTE